MSRPRSRDLIIATFLGLLTLTTVACGSDEAAGSPAADTASTPTTAGPIAVVASTDVYGSIVERIGGKAVAVTSIIDDDGADPLEYESTPADAAAISRAQVVVFNGNGYDDFMPQLVEAADVDLVVDVSTLSGLQAEAAGEEFNEHMWYDLPTVQKLAVTLADDLGRMRPDAAPSFRDNAAAFTGELDGLTTRLSDIAAAHRDARVAVTEPLANHLLADAGLVNAAPEDFQEAVEEGADPPAAVLKEMLALFQGTPVEVLVLNTQTQSAVTDRVVQAAERAGVPVVEMSETLRGTDYPSWMGAQIKALEQALGA